MEVTSARNPVALDPNLLKAGYNGIDDTKVAAEAKQAAETPILFGASVLVSNGITDLEALLAQMKNENADTRTSMKLKTLSSIAQGLSSQQLAALEKSLALADSVQSLEKAVNDQKRSISDNEAKLKVLEAETEALAKQVENLRETQAEHNKNVEKLTKEKAELQDKLAKLEAEKNAENAEAIAALKTEIAGVEKSIAANVDGMNAVEKKIAEVSKSLGSAREKVAELTAAIDVSKADIAEKMNAISGLNAEISAVLSSASIDKNTLKTIAAELAKVAPEEKADSPRDVEKKEEKAEATDLVRIIRDSMDAIAEDILDEIAERREQMV